MPPLGLTAAQVPMPACLRLSCYTKKRSPALPAWARAQLPSARSSGLARSFTLSLLRGVQVQLGNQVAVVQAQAVAPRLVAARPAAILAQQRPEDAAAPGPCSDDAQHRARGRSSAQREEGVVTLWGYGISGSHDMVVCRQGGEPWRAL